MREINIESEKESLFQKKAGHARNDGVYRPKSVYKRQKNARES